MSLLNPEWTTRWIQMPAGTCNYRIGTLVCRGFEFKQSANAQVSLGIIENDRSQLKSRFSSWTDCGLVELTILSMFIQGLRNVFPPLDHCSKTGLFWLYFRIVLNKAHSRLNQVLLLWTLNFVTSSLIFILKWKLVVQKPVHTLFCMMDSNHTWNWELQEAKY